MKRFFTSEGDRALRASMVLQPLLAFDFDGTLAPIVARPDEARVSTIVSSRLAELGRHLPVAIITGRSVADVLPRLGFAPAFVVGNHGVEDPEVAPPVAASLALDGMRRRVAAQGAALAKAGVAVEDKQFSLALHYRLAPDADAARDCIDTLLQGIEPALRRFGGKCVVNVLAASLPDKGDALATLVQRAKAGAAVFMGDDVNDEAVFARAVPPWLTIRIGGDDPGSRAMYFIDDNVDLARVLERMLVALRGSP